mgnify:FL=1
MKLSFVIPCYNEESNVKLIHDEIAKIFLPLYKYEIIFVNDGSSDNTLKSLKEILKNSKTKIKVINFSRNFGKEAAIYAGLKEAKGDYISLIDADMQQDPKYVMEMVSFLDKNEEYDSVAMYQDKRKEGKVLTFFKKSFYKLINKISDTKFQSNASDFRTFRKCVIKSVLELKEYYRFSKGIFSWVGYNTYYMPYTVKERATGTTKWSFKKLFKYALDGIISFTTAPLKMATYIGLMSSFASIVYLVFVIIQKLAWGIDIPGYATIITLILFLGGMQLFSLGIIGEYIGRNYIETKNRPIYIAKEILENKE